MTISTQGNCMVCEHFGPDVLAGWVSADSFLICRMCAADWLSVAWHEFHQQRAA